MRVLSRSFPGPLPQRPDGGFMRVSALWLLGAATLFVVGSLVRTTVAAPPPSSRVLSPAVLVTLAVTPPVEASAAPGPATDADHTRSSADPQAGGHRSSPTAGDSGAAAVPAGTDGSSLLGPPWPPTGQGWLSGSESGAPSTTTGTSGAPAIVTTARPMSTGGPAVTPTTSPSSSAPRTVTVTRVLTLSDDHQDDHDDDHDDKDDHKDDHDSHDD
jgi:hypothetical protein